MESWVMDLALVKCLWEKENGKYTIIFLKNGEELKIYTKEFHKFEVWKETLRTRVLVTDIHDEYVIY